MNFNINEINLATPPTIEEVGKYNNQTVVIKRIGVTATVFLLKRGQKFKNGKDLYKITQQTITISDGELGQLYTYKNRGRRVGVNPANFSLEQQEFAGFALNKSRFVEVPEVTQLDKLKSLINSEVESAIEKPIMYSVLVFLNGMIISEGIEELIKMYHGDPNFFEALLFYIQN